MSKTVGEIIVKTLSMLGSKVVFGIPGVHSAELYRGLARENIRHVTPRHEQGAGFMADGYARRSGVPGVCFVITGPGLTNIITPMAQAYADRIPMLVISTVNPTPLLGNNTGLLHALPDQSALAKTVALKSYTITKLEKTAETVFKAYYATLGPRKGPIHIQIPTNKLEAKVTGKTFHINNPKPLESKTLRKDILKCTKLIEKENKVIILAGGGASNASEELANLSKTLSAPVLLTINARGIMPSHPMALPASPSLRDVRNLLSAFDLALVVGSELGPTDYDMFGVEKTLKFKKIVRIDIDPEPNAGNPKFDLNINHDSKIFLKELINHLKKNDVNKKKFWASNERKIAITRAKIIKNLTRFDRKAITLLEKIYLYLPNAVIVGDSTKPVYAGNNFIQTPAPRTWFNAATGFGALGFAPPAAIGAQIADPKSQLICLVGDGGFQFSLTEIGTACDEKLPIIYLVWNNHGYKEIADFMKSKKIKRIGVKPSPPNFRFIANSYSIPYFLLKNMTNLRSIFSKAVIKMRKGNFKPCIIEIDEKKFSFDKNDE